MTLATPVSFYRQIGPCPNQQRYVTLAAPGAMTSYEQPTFRSLFGKNRKDSYDRQVRKETLSYFPALVDCDELLEAGFFYTGDDDIVECFCCCTKYGNWKADDKPLEVHRRLSPHCQYLKSITNRKASDVVEGPASSKQLACNSANQSRSQSEAEESEAEDEIDGVVTSPVRRRCKSSKAKHPNGRTSRIVLGNYIYNASLLMCFISNLYCNQSLVIAKFRQCIIDVAFSVFINLLLPLMHTVTHT